MIKAEFPAAFLQSSVSHDPSEITLIYWFFFDSLMNRKFNKQYLFESFVTLWDIITFDRLTRAWYNFGWTFARWSWIPFEIWIIFHYFVNCNLRVSCCSCFSVSNVMCGWSRLDDLAHTSRTNGCVDFSCCSSANAAKCSCKNEVLETFDFSTNNRPQHQDGHIYTCKYTDPPDTRERTSTDVI